MGSDRSELKEVRALLERAGLEDAIQAIEAESTHGEPPAQPNTDSGPSREWEQQLHRDLQSAKLRAERWKVLCGVLLLFLIMGSPIFSLQLEIRLEPFTTDVLNVRVHHLFRKDETYTLKAARDPADNNELRWMRQLPSGALEHMDTSDE